MARDQCSLSKLLWDRNGISQIYDPVYQLFFFILSKQSHRYFFMQKQNNGLQACHRKKSILISVFRILLFHDRHMFAMNPELSPSMINVGLCAILQ
jgi:hypothetical protein